MNLTEKYQAVREAVITAVPDVYETVEWRGDEPLISRARPIQLHDVLRAIKFAEEARNLYYVTVYASGAMCLFEKSMEGPDMAISQCDWNLAEPLENQPTQTIDFLHSILCKNV